MSSSSDPSLASRRQQADQLLYTNDIGVEGYQKSNMVEHHRADLAYGVLVRGIPKQCDGLRARAIDLGGTSQRAGSSRSRTRRRRTSSSTSKMATPPAGWVAVTSTGGEGTSLSIDASAAHSGTQGLLCVDESTTEASTQRAGIEYPLPPGRFEWRAEGWFNPTSLELGDGQSLYVLYFLSGSRLSAAARIHNDAQALRPGLVARSADDALRGRDGPSVIVRADGASGGWSSSGWERVRRPPSCISTTARA